MTILRTERLTLTPMGVDDFADLKAVWADPAFVKHITGQPMKGEEVWLRLLRDIGHWQVLGRGNWCVRRTDDGAYVGGVGVLDFRRDLTPPFDAPELGWGISPRFQGQGMAFEAVSAALAWCDETLNVSRTVCMISPGNMPSMTLAERLGFVRYADGDYKGETITLLERHSR